MLLDIQTTSQRKEHWINVPSSERDLDVSQGQQFYIKNLHSSCHISLLQNSYCHYGFKSNNRIDLNNMIALHPFLNTWNYIWRKVFHLVPHLQLHLYKKQVFIREHSYLNSLNILWPSVTIHIEYLNLNLSWVFNIFNWSTGKK